MHFFNKCTHFCLFTYLLSLCVTCSLATLHFIFTRLGVSHIFLTNFGCFLLFILQCIMFCILIGCWQSISCGLSPVQNMFSLPNVQKKSLIVIRHFVLYLYNTYFSTKVWTLKGLKQGRKVLKCWCLSGKSIQSVQWWVLKL